MQLRWLVSVSASAHYAAAALLRGQSLVDPGLAIALADPVEALREACETAGVDPAPIADQLTAVASEQTAVAEQARIAVRKAAGEAQVARLAGAVNHFAQQVQLQFSACFPDALQQLELRSLPLREQWEARGPGLMKMLGRFIGSDEVPETADVILIQPVTGGGGVAHAAYNRVSFEALLVNPASEVPEVVRLGWLLGQLQFDLPAVQGTLSRQRLFEIGALGLVPAILAAAHEVELTGPADLLLPQALDLWRLDKRHVDTLRVWWESYEADRPSWTVALAALDQMLKVA